MPVYTYCCNKCDYEFEDILTIENRNIPCGNSCPRCQAENAIYQKIGAPPIVGGVGTHAKIDDTFKDILKTMKSNAGKHSTIDI